MTKVKKCRNTSPRLFDRFVMWLGFDKDLHNWKLYRRESKYTIYYCRKCECGVDQVKNNGSIGNKQWQDISVPFRWDWERREFEAANIIDT